MRTRQITIYHFEPDRNIREFLSNPNIIKPTEVNCLRIRGSWAQFRIVVNTKSPIVGRLCKIKLEEKPTIGEAFDLQESTLEKDIIESCHFLYNEKINRLLIQKNHAVSTNPNALMCKLLLHVFPEIRSEGLGIPAIIRNDALERIIENRGMVKNITVKTTGEQRKTLNIDQETDLEFRDDFLDDTAFKKVTLKYELTIGSLKKPIIEKLSKYFTKGKIEDAAFELEEDRSPIKLSEYVKKDKIDVQLDENGHIMSSDMFKKLQLIDIQ